MGRNEGARSNDGRALLVLQGSGSVAGERPLYRIDGDERTPLRMSKSYTSLVRALRARLGHPLPGSPAQLNMAPASRAAHDQLSVQGKNCREAAVLALIFPGAEGASLLLTLRRSDLPDHPGQISFPGGSRDADEKLERTALREAHEELGLDPDHVDVLGTLTPLYIPPSGFCVYPFVGSLEALPPLAPHEAEVAAVLEVPLAHLLEENTRVSEEWVLRGEPVVVPFYRYGAHKVWGATAMILAELLEVLRMGSSPRVPTAP